MARTSEPIDRRMVARDQADVAVRPWWRPSPLSCWFLAMVTFDALILIVASGSDSDSDAAGNGMAKAFQTVFVQAGGVLVGCLALLFVVIRHRGTRIGLLAALALVTLLLLMLQ